MNPDALDDNDRERIINNIKRAFEFKGYRLYFI
jgi:hypothetical protein